MQREALSTRAAIAAWAVFVAIIAAAIVALVVMVGTSEAGERPADGWRYSDRVYERDGRTPLPLDNSQAMMRKLLIEVGHSGAGRKQTVLGLDGPRSQEGRLLYWIANGDTLWRAALPHAQCLDAECSFLSVVGGAAPDSSTLVFVDWSTLTLANDGKVRRR